MSPPALGSPSSGRFAANGSPARLPFFSGRSGRPGSAPRPRPGTPRSVHRAVVRVVARRDVPEGLVVGLASGVEDLAGGVVVHVAVGQEVQARVQRQRPVRRRPVEAPRAGGGVEGLGLLDVGAGVEGAVRVDRLHQLGHAAGHEHLPVGQRDERRVPAAVVHRAGLRPGLACTGRTRGRRSVPSSSISPYSVPPRFPT